MSDEDEWLQLPEPEGCYPSPIVCKSAEHVPVLRDGEPIGILWRTPGGGWTRIMNEGLVARHAELLDAEARWAAQSEPEKETERWDVI